MKYYVEHSVNEELIQYAKTKGLHLPDKAIFLYAKSQNKIKSLIVLRKIYMIEPLISENHRATLKLLNLVFDFQSKEDTVIRAFISKKLLKLAKKLGFTQEFKDKIIIERRPQWREHQKENKQ